MKSRSKLHLSAKNVGNTQCARCEYRCEYFTVYLNLVTPDASYGLVHYIDSPHARVERAVSSQSAGAIILVDFYENSPMCVCSGKVSCPPCTAAEPNERTPKESIEECLRTRTKRERACPPFLMRRMHCMRPYHQVGGRGSLTRYRT